jgi:hypothetical protein
MSMAHRTVTAIFHGSDIPTMVEQIYCDDDEIGRRTAIKAVHAYAETRGKTVKVVSATHDGQMGWDVECVEAAQS